MKPIIAIPMGDAAGIGPEITVRALADKMIQDIARCVVVGDKDVLEDAIRVSGVDLKIKCIEEPANGDYTPGVLNLIDLDNIDMNTLKIGAENIANFSGDSFARLFGDISPKINTSTVITTVDRVTPALP